MSRKRSAALVAAGALVGGLVMMISGAFAQGNTAATLSLLPGNNVGVSCPNSLSNANRQSQSETVECAANPPTTTAPPTTSPPTTTAPTTTPPTTTPPTTDAPTTTTVPSSGGTCTSPVWSSSNAEGADTVDSTWTVNNDAWNGSHGPQTIYMCSPSSWYAVSNQTDQGGAVETYPDTEYFTNSTEPISQYNSITSTFSEAFPTDNSVDAGYDLWMNNWSKEIMIWNEDAGDQTYYNTQGTPETIGGVNYEWVDRPAGGEQVFIMQNQEKSGTVDILSVLNFLVAQGKLLPTDVPTQLEYGVEITATNGTETFPMNDLTFSTS